MVVENLTARAAWLRRETIRWHMRFPETRLASSLSLIEILVCLFAEGTFDFFGTRHPVELRDRLLIGKGHGAVALYPLLLMLGKLPTGDDVELMRRFGAAPEGDMPGTAFLTASLGNALGVACGMALALRDAAAGAKVVTVVGDGEIQEGSVWEAVAFATRHSLSNMLLIIDANGRSMLGDCEAAVSLEPLCGRFAAAGWQAQETDGHSCAALLRALMELQQDSGAAPKVLIARTVKGKGIPELEQDPLAHIRQLTREQGQRYGNEGCDG